MAVGTNQGVAGLAPRPFTLGEETGSHDMVMVMYVAPACSPACTSGIVAPKQRFARSDSARAGGLPRLLQPHCQLGLPLSVSLKRCAVSMLLLVLLGRATAAISVAPRACRSTRPRARLVLQLAESPPAPSKFSKLMAGEDRVTEFEDVGISDGIEWRALRANPGGHQYAELTAKLVDPATTVTREMYLVKSLLSESEIDALRARIRPKHGTPPTQT